MLETARNIYSSALSAWLSAHYSDVVSSASEPGWNWDRFVALASSSGVLCTLHSGSLPADLLSQIPLELQNLFATAQRLNAERNSIALNQIVALSRALNAARIEPIVLKGSAQLLAGTYPTLGSRYIADIDLLIPAAQQFESAVAVFKSLGYEAEALHSLEFQIGHTYPPLTRLNSLEIDLHRVLGLGPSASFVPPSTLAETAVNHELDGALVRTLSPTNLVVHHILHSQLHDVYRERISPSLRTLYDFSLLIRHFGDTIDWLAIEALFRRNGQYATLALYLLEAQSSFHIKPPIPLTLDPTLLLRHARRQWFHRWPALRFVDPSYYWFAGVQPRTRRLREILSHPGGLGYLLGKFISPHFYARLRTDLHR